MRAKGFTMIGRAAYGWMGRARGAGQRAPRRPAHRATAFALLIAPFVVLVAACSSDGGAHTARAVPVAAAVTGGTLDDGDVAVVALLRGSRLVCSGALVAPRVVVTAAHCLAAARPDAVYFGPDATTAGVDAPLPAETIPVIDKRPHPDFVSATLDDDLAVVLLARAAKAIPLAMMVGSLDASFTGREARLVGYGRTSAAASGGARKRAGTAKIGEVGDRSFAVEPSPSLPCSGDSGGPILVSVDGVERVAGVVAGGDAACIEPAKVTRLDAFVSTFVDPYVAETSDRAAQPGARCFYAANCARGECWQPSDAPGFMYCSTACGADGDCPAGAKCVEVDVEPRGAPRRACRWPTPSPGAMGAPCTTPVACAFGMCGRVRDDAPRVCSKLCFRDQPDTCPDPLACRRNVDKETAYGCFGAWRPAPPITPGTPATPSSTPFGTSGGCSVARAGATAGAGALGVVAVVAMLVGAGARRRGRASAARRKFRPVPRH